MSIKICEVCNNNFTVKQIQNPNRFCSVPCKHIGVGKQVSLALKGRKLPEEHKRKIGLANSIALKGKKLSEERKKKMSETQKKLGKPPPKQYGNKWNIGRKHTEEWKKAMSEAHRGEKSASWRGGVSFEPYGLEFNRGLKNEIRRRDKYRCQECFQGRDELYTKRGNKYKLIVHHIDFNKKNNTPENLISLCRICHLQTNYNRENWIKYYQERMGN